MYRIETLTRAALDQHLEEFLRIDRGTQGECWDARHFVLELPDKWSCSRVILNDLGRAVGFVIVSVRGSDLHVHRLAIDESHRRLGLGGRLIDQVTEAAAQRSARRVTLKVSRNNVGALQFYSRCGFSKAKIVGGNFELSIVVDP